MKFLPIYPRGLGTADVESLGSFLVRSATAHRLSANQFAACLVTEGREFLTEGSWLKRWRSRNLLSQNDPLASPNKTARALVDILDRLYETNVFRSLGLFALYPHFTEFKWIFRTGFAWCPLCWQEDVESGQAPYFRFIWAVKCYRVCDLHHCRMVSRCGVCGELFNFWLRDKMEVCRRCKSSLYDEEHTCLAEPSNGYYQDILGFVKFIQDNPGWQFEAPDKRDLLPAYLSDEIEGLRFQAQGNKLLKRYAESPSLFRLRSACWFFQLDLWRVLSLTQKQLPLFKEEFYGRKVPHSLQGDERSCLLDNDKMLAKLKKLLHENTMSPRPAKFYARQLGISSDGLKYRFPQVYSRMVQYYDFHKNAERSKLKMEIDLVLEMMGREGSLEMGVKKICHELMREWGFPKNVSREKIKKFRDSI